MSAASPGVSIVVPTYGREQVLCDTLAALFALAPPADEILIADQTPRHDPATEDFLRCAAAEKRVRWLRLSPPGVVAAMNRGLREALGEIVLFLDDDIVPGTALVAAHRAVFESFPDAWAVVGRVVQPEDSVPIPAKVPPATRHVAARHEPFGRRGARPISPLRRDLDFHFDSASPGWVENVIACNLSVRRDRALALGGFDECFIPPVSYRFETEFAKRIIAAGGRIRYEPAAAVRHLRAARGGTRSLGSHLTSASPLHGVGDYYYALKCGRGWDRLRYMVRRPFREVCTRFHLRHPWWIPVKFVGELRALALALRLYRRGGAGRLSGGTP